MFCVRRATYVVACLAVAGTACSTEEPAVSPDRLHGISDDSSICKAVKDRFVGIPGLDEGTTPEQSPALKGSWWIRGCSAKRVANGLRMRFEGPGWYFLDHRDSDFTLHQQVTFALGVELEGAPELTLDNGVATLHFETKTTPEVELQIGRDLDLHPTSAWGELISLMPAVSVRNRAAKQLSALAVGALRSKLREGASATYELSSGQRSVALGKLPAGQTPRTVFTDGIPWLINERVFLAPEATQVLGPIDPGRTRLDARIEQGSGLAYRTVCESDMPADYETIASGHVDRLPLRTSAAHGALNGLGEHSAIFQVDRCKFFVVVSTLGESTSVAALRIRE